MHVGSVNTSEDQNSSNLWILCIQLFTLYLWVKSSGALRLLDGISYVGFVSCFTALVLSLPAVGVTLLLLC